VPGRSQQPPRPDKARLYPQGHLKAYMECRSCEVGWYGAPSEPCWMCGGKGTVPVRSQTLKEAYDSAVSRAED